MEAYSSPSRGAELIKGINYSTAQNTLETILNRLSNPKYYSVIKGVRWTKANYAYFTKSRHCCARTITNCLNKLIEAKIIIKEKLSKSEGDMTNWYSLNLESATEEMLEKISVFFNKYIAQKIRNTIVSKISTLRVERFYPYKSRKTPLGKKSEEPAAAAATPGGLRVVSGEETSKAKTTTAQDALTIWNEVTERNDRMSKPLARFFVAAIKLKFQTLEKWKEFCLLVKSSSFLMSGRFRSVLYFVLKFDAIDKILKGMYGVRDAEGKLVSQRIQNSRKRNVLSSGGQKSVVVGKSCKNKMAINANLCNGASNDDGAALKHIESLGESKECLQVRKEILQRFGEQQYLAWMTKVELTLTEWERIEVSGNNLFIVDRVQTQFVNTITLRTINNTA